MSKKILCIFVIVVNIFLLSLGLKIKIKYVRKNKIIIKCTSVFESIEETLRWIIGTLTIRFIINKQTNSEGNIIEVSPRIDNISSAWVNLRDSSSLKNFTHIKYEKKIPAIIKSGRLMPNKVPSIKK